MTSNIKNLKICVYNLKRHAVKQNNISFKLAELKIVNSCKHIITCAETDSIWYLSALTETLQLISMYELFNSTKELAHIKLSVENLFEDLNS